MDLSIGQIPTGLFNPVASVFATTARTQRPQPSILERPSVLTSLNRGGSSPTPFPAPGEDVSRFVSGQRTLPLSPAGAAFTTLEERQEDFHTRLEEARVNPTAVEVRPDETLIRTQEAGDDQFPFDAGDERSPTATGEGTREVGFFPEGGVRPAFADERTQNTSGLAVPLRATSEFQSPASTFMTPQSPVDESFTPQGLETRLDMTA